VIITAQDLTEARVYPFQAMSWAAGIIGGIALVLTDLGNLRRARVRRREADEGNRHPHGARRERRRGRRLILKQSMRLCAIGLGIGLTLAVALSTALASTLVMMDTFDLAAFSAWDRHRHRGVSGRSVLPRAEGGGGGTIGGAENRIAPRPCRGDAQGHLVRQTLRPWRMCTTTPRIPRR
jgi:hypothetical protein